MNQKLWTAAGLGAVSGLRTLTGVASVSRELAGRRRLPRSASRLEAWLADDLVAAAVTGLALGELVADKLPGLPDRVAPGPLFGRATVGGVLGALAAGADHRAAGAVAGMAGAVAGAYLGWFLRREAARVTLLPDPAIALVEDAVAVTAGRELAAEL